MFNHKQIGDYVTSKYLGKGQFGEVYKAYLKSDPN